MTEKEIPDQPILDKEQNLPESELTDTEDLRKKRKKKIILIVSISFGSLLILIAILYLILYFLGYAMCGLPCKWCESHSCLEAENCNECCEYTCLSCLASLSVKPITNLEDLHSASEDFDTISYFNTGEFNKLILETIREWFYNLFN